MKSIWLTFIKNYIRLGLFFYHKKIVVAGKENIPKKGAVLFVCNHQNALLDPLIIGTTNKRNTHFLARAGVFKKKILAKFFGSVQMIPIYRIRDGWQTLSKNEAIFQKCIQILKDEKALLIFPEGSHNLKRTVRPLSKGFTRILFGALEKYPDLNIQIVPIGLNYNSILNYPSSVVINYGKPLNLQKYWDKDDVINSTNFLKEDVRAQIKLLTTHIENNENYDMTLTKLKSLNADFLNPIETNKLIKNIDKREIKTITKQPTAKKTLLYYIVILNSIIPWLIWKKLQKKITELEFTSTFRYGLGITLFPLFYTIQSFILMYFFGTNIAAIYFITCLFLGLLLTKYSKVYQD
ncbi:lysophospholipid acyltransferase family protein [Urechidicola croceus]|uniref:Phospholipid/glycerol acyltransferase domain-containing protein n=1 Tax=Urechidicola croceus TaxID=1850246 RepID=A0A1D8PBH5_9FLAO|nr:lysophospholipid acyltransferase family protein [Urechidicola croceus]AOW21924.1 hypothetical protein LPB138_15050 [Urechidicola croceus]